MVHLAVTMYSNWPTDHAIDHSSIGLNRLTVQLVFNEVSLEFSLNGAELSLNSGNSENLRNH